MELPPPATLELRPTRVDELPQLVRLEHARGTREFVMPGTLDAHRVSLAHERFVYLSILDLGALAGFIVLHLDAEPHSVEFRRIVVGRPDRGIGQRAIVAMEALCRTALGRRRIWLDVFDDNRRARHVYEKLGYRQFGERAYDDRVLLLYDKTLV